MLPICFYAIRLLRFMAVHGHCRNKKTTMYKLKSDSYTLVASLIDWSQNIILTEWNLHLQNFTVMCIWLHISLFTGFFAEGLSVKANGQRFSGVFSGWLCDCPPPWFDRAFLDNFCTVFFSLDPGPSPHPNHICSAPAALCPPPLTEILNTPLQRFCLQLSSPFVCCCVRLPLSDENYSASVPYTHSTSANRECGMRHHYSSRCTTNVYSVTVTCLFAYIETPQLFSKDGAASIAAAAAARWSTVKHLRDLSSTDNATAKHSSPQEYSTNKWKTQQLIHDACHRDYIIILSSNTCMKMHINI